MVFRILTSKWLKVVGKVNGSNWIVLMDQIFKEVNKIGPGNGRVELKSCQQTKLFSNTLKSQAQQRVNFSNILDRDQPTLSRDCRSRSDIKERAG